jgi:hypothetical protein
VEPDVKLQVSQNWAGGLGKHICMFQDGVSTYAGGVYDCFVWLVWEGKIADELETLRVSDPSEGYVHVEMWACCVGFDECGLYMHVFVAHCSWPGGGGDQLSGDMSPCLIAGLYQIDQVFLMSSIRHVPSFSSFTLGAGLFTLATCG